MTGFKLGNYKQNGFRRYPNILDHINFFEENWKKLAYRIGISSDRQQIFEFLHELYLMDSKLSVVVLKTFVSSGKTSSLAAYLLSKLRMGQSAVFMTPSLHEVVSFILGIRTEIEDYVNSDDVKVKNSFNRMILELHEKLKHLDVFEHPPVFGQKVDEKSP